MTALAYLFPAAMLVIAAVAVCAVLVPKRGAR